MRSVNDLFIEFENRIICRKQMGWDFLQVGIQTYAEVRLFRFYLIKELLAIH